MKIYNADKIIPGLLIFVAVLTLPFWFNLGRASTPPEPKIDTPAIQQMKDKTCILPKVDMRSGHMQILNDWRTQVVRNGMRDYHAPDGKIYNMSLQNECLKCHSNKAQFCDQCHTYMAVVPYCWTCHVEPPPQKENK
jgi:hypothetical protein